MEKTLFDFKDEADDAKNIKTAAEELKEESKYYDSKILIVDDSEFYISQCVQLLNKLGYRNIESFDNPIDMIANLRNVNPDLILMDTELGTTMRGYEAAKEVKNGSFKPEVAIVGMSSASGYKDKWLEIGVDGFICKRDFGIGMIFENMIKNALRRYYGK